VCLPGAVLLGPNGLNVQGPEIGYGPEAKVACRDSLSEKAGFGECQGHVPDLHPPENVPLIPLIKKVHVVDGRKLPGFVVIDVDMDSFGDDSRYQEPELNIRLKSREKTRVTAFLEAHLAGLEAGPIPSKFSPPPKPNRDVGKLRLKERRSLLILGDRDLPLANRKGEWLSLEPSNRQAGKGYDLRVYPLSIKKVCGHLR